MAEIRLIPEGAGVRPVVRAAVGGGAGSPASRSPASRSPAGAGDPVAACGAIDRRLATAIGGVAAIVRSINALSADGTIARIRALERGTDGDTTVARTFAATARVGRD